MLKLRIHPEARQELFEAAAFYERRVTGLGDDFVEEYRSVLHQIIQSPERAHLVFRDYQRRNFRRFPYAIIYRLSGDTLFVIALAHHRRRPFYWQSRGS